MLIHLTLFWMTETVAMMNSPCVWAQRSKRWISNPSSLLHPFPLWWSSVFPPYSGHKGSIGSVSVGTPTFVLLGWQPFRPSQTNRGSNQLIVLWDGSQKRGPDAEMFYTRVWGMEQLQTCTHVIIESIELLLLGANVRAAAVARSQVWIMWWKREGRRSSNSTQES